MRFSTICTGLLSAVSLAAAAPTVEKRALTAQQMVDNINTITDQSRQLRPVVMNIQTGDTAIAKRQLSNPFEPVINGFQQIIRTATDDITSMDGTQPYNDADAQKVCNAFSNFVVVHQSLLNVVIGKSGLLEGIFLGPVAAVLRSLEDVVDTFAFGLIDVVPVCMADATTKKNSLDDTLGKAVCAYTPGGSLGVDLFC